MLMRIMRNASTARLALIEKPLNEAMQECDIGSPLRAAAFIAQIAHESGQLRYMEETWGPTASQKRYEPPGALAKTLGNTQKGDGMRFRGRGPIQITGRANYARYGEMLDVDLVAAPELAATAEHGFRIAALFWQKNGLNELADAGDFKAITRRINGGHNGLAERERFYDLARAVFTDAFPSMRPRRVQADGRRRYPKFARGADGDVSLPAPRPVAGAAAKRKSTQSRTLDARADTMDFRDHMFEPTLVEVPTHIPLGDYLDFGVPILDQGSEGACTGYGLAAVANYLLRRRRVIPDITPVSPRMFYDLARRYDEWPGENYSGSSARGAMKGWHKHGVCSEDIYPSRKAARPGLSAQRTDEARRRPLGAYFRVNHKDLVAMHAAITEVGILYATCVVHEGWDNVGSDGVIASSDRSLGGHAFAIVAYDDEGFWLQNSWGPDWGQGGFGRISYDDWLRNGTDVWVARLGAPVTLHDVESTAALHAASAGESAAYAYADLRPHIVSVGNDGLLNPGGDYAVTPADLQHIFEDDIPRVTADWPKVRILLYAHGGLVSQESAVQRLADYRPDLLWGQVYPLAFIWRSDYWTTVTNILEDTMRRRRPEGALDAAKDFILDRLDDALEPLARTLSGKSAWGEMKENALAASNKDCAAWLVVKHLKAMSQQGWLKGRPLEIHLVGHSAGSILHAGVVSRLVESKLPIESCTLWAPACTMDVFNEHYLAPIKSKLVKKFNLYVLSDKAEQDDNCARIYNKSLLYLVSNAFEARARIPGFRDGEPILGMQRWLDAGTMALFKPGSRHQLVIAPNDNDAATGYGSQARHHGDFDDDPLTVLSTFSSIAGQAFTPAPDAAGATQGRPGLFIHRNRSSLRDRRAALDARTIANIRQ
jgi:predicted chitinase